MNSPQNPPSSNPALDDSIRQFDITRVVGPGTADEFINGFLVNWQDYVNHGILSEKATIKVKFLSLASGTGIPPLPPNYATGALTVWVNGHPEQERAQINLLTTRERCVTISTRYLRFAQRAAAGSTPVAAKNDIAFQFSVNATPPGAPRVLCPGVTPEMISVYQCTSDVLSSSFFWSPLDLYSTYTPRVAIGNLSFGAMAPVVLIHGYNSGPWAWDLPTPGTPSACPLDPAGEEVGNGFIQPLIAAKVPFDCTIQMPPQASIQAGATTLSQKLGPVLASFGACDLAPQAKTACHVNFVVHSKGGLWTRKFIKSLSATPWVGVDSFTTVDTPHHGSPIADMAHVARLGPLRVQGSPQTQAATLAYHTFADHTPAFAAAWGNAVEDLTVARVNEFNLTAPILPPANFRLVNLHGEQLSPLRTCYYSISSDADQTGDGEIAGAEGYPYNEIFGSSNFPLGELLTNTSYQFIKRVLKVEVESIVSGIPFTPDIVRVHEVPNDVPQLNDIIVSVNSARFPGFYELVSRAGANGRTHNTVKDAVAANLILPLIPMSGSNVNSCLVSQ